MSVVSPDKSIKVQVQLETFTYSVTMAGEPVLAQSALGLESRDQSLWLAGRCCIKSGIQRTGRGLQSGANSPYNYHLPLRFLPRGTYVAHSYADPSHAGDSYEALARSTKQVTAQGSLDLHMRLAGGPAIYLEPANSQASTAGGR